MGYFRIQAILIAGIGGPEDTIWIQILVLLLLAALWGIYSLVKSKQNQFRDQQQNLAKETGPHHAKRRRPFQLQHASEPIARLDGQLKVESAAEQNAESQKDKHQKNLNQNYDENIRWFYDCPTPEQLGGRIKVILDLYALPDAMGDAMIYSDEDSPLLRNNARLTRKCYIGLQQQGWQLPDLPGNSRTALDDLQQIYERCIRAEVQTAAAETTKEEVVPKKRRTADDRNDHVTQAYEALANSPTIEAQHLATWINDKYGDKYGKIKANNVTKS
jgi:hypothetical protein